MTGKEGNIMNDNVNHPNHYTQSGVECIDYIREMISPYAGVVAGDIQNVLKYTWRAHDKNGIEDIKKAKWYMNHAVRLMEHGSHARFNAEGGSDIAVMISPVVTEGKKQVLERLPENERPYYKQLTDTLFSGRLYFGEWRDKALQALDGWEKAYVGKQKSEEKNVNHPKHYASGKIECIDYLEVMVAPYAGIVAGCVQNALKYTWRSHGKNGVEDIKKAQWYLKYADNVINNNRDKKYTFRPVYYEPSEKDKKLCEAGYQQVVDGLSKEEKIYYNMLYQCLKDGQFLQSKMVRDLAIRTLDDWSKSYQKEREVKEIVVEQPKSNEKSKNL